MAGAVQMRVRNTTLEHARLLLVDDEPVNILILRDMLEQAGYSQIMSTSDPLEALSLYRSFKPDLLLLDLMMPQMDGIEVIEKLHAEEPNGNNIPILILTADVSPEAKRRTLQKGASDFLNKPFDVVELLLRINNLLETRFLYLDLQWQNETLEYRVKARTAELEAARQHIVEYAQQLEEAQMETLERLAKAGEFRDDETGQHTQRVSKTTELLARRLGLAPERTRWIYQAARLHDVGKIGISDLTLLKPDILSPDEYALMKTHTTLGAKLLEGGRTELMQLAQQIAQSHHERWDGTGYPEGLRGEEIPVAARILAVADVFDALTHDRPYKKAWPISDAVDEIERQSGHQFDPRVVEEFLQLPQETLL